MLLRSGFEYLYSAPSTSSSRANANRKRKAVDDSLNERPLKRQDTSPVLQGEPSIVSSLPASLPSLPASPPAPLPASPSALLPASPSDRLSGSPPALLFGSLSGSLPGSPPSPLPAAPLPAVSPTDLKGKIIGGEFRLLRVLGQGGDACVYLGRNLQDRSLVAVKILSKPECHAHLQLQQLEIDIQQSLQHANLVPLLRLFQDSDFFYLVMELCDQGDLFDYLSEDHDEASFSREQMAKQLFPQILSGVEHMHANGVYHGDLKPENVFLKSQGDAQDFVCKVGDFGLATRERFSLEFCRGSTAFIAPEQVDPSKQDRPYDAAASDVWALGIMMLLMLVESDFPWQQACDEDLSFYKFKHDSPKLKEQPFPGLSPAALRLLLSMLAVDPADRPSVSRVKEQFSAIDRLCVDDADSKASGHILDATHL